MFLSAAAAVAAAVGVGLWIVARAWPAREPLPWLAWIGLAGLLGPCAVGFGLLLCGTAGLPAPVSVPALAAASAAATVDGIRRRAVLPAVSRGSRADHMLAVLVLLAATWTGMIAMRTHLGWDGTVVWYHKARLIADNDGAPPVQALADATRTWAAPDYPLQVPLAMAWVRLWLPVEDERAIKLLPAAWASALFCIVAAAVLERSREDPYRTLRAAGAVLVLATAPRVLVGEGSVTSGYADGPMAALLAATVWTAWRAGWGRDRRFTYLLALLGVALAWTKQEGTAAVIVLAFGCVWSQRRWTAGSFALPAMVLAAAWQVWTMAQGAPTGMAYAWPGVWQAAARVAPIAGAYIAEALDLGTWGVLWPGLCGALVCNWTRSHRMPLAMLVAVGVIAAGAFTVSVWPDVHEHLRVTVPRQLVQLAALATLLAFSAGCTIPDSRPTESSKLPAEGH